MNARSESGKAASTKGQIALPQPLWLRVECVKGHCGEGTGRRVPSLLTHGVELIVVNDT